MKEPTPGRPNFVRRLYDWVLSWANTPHGTIALAVLSFAESSFFPIPPDVLLIALVLGRSDKWFRLALVCSLASVAGGVAGYFVGWGLWGQLDQWFFATIPGFNEARFAKVQELYQDWDFWLVFTAGFTPIPYKLITITAGVASLNLPMFILASALSRSARFFLVAGLLRKFGPTIAPFIDRRFNLLVSAFTVLLIGGVVVLKFLL